MCSNVVKVARSGDDREKVQILNQLQECLFHHACDKDLSADRLAKLMYMSRPTLFRKVKRLTGLTPNELIVEIRLKRAAALLAAGEYRVLEVARMVGYISQSGFGKSFLKQYKITPAAYQRAVGDYTRPRRLK